MIHKQARCRDEAANHQLPIAVAFWVIWIVSMEECSSLTQNLVQIHCSTHSVILNVTATQYTCSLNGAYRPHWLVQWSCHCSHMCIPVHSPWLPGCMDVTQTILVILTMAGLFPDRPRMYTTLHQPALYGTMSTLASTCRSKIKEGKWEWLIINSSDPGANFPFSSSQLGALLV